MRTTAFYKYFLTFASFATIAGCGGSDSTNIDKLLGNFSSAPILTSVPDQTVQQEDLLTIDVNNIKDGLPGTDKDMSYTCTFDNTVDGKVEAGADCSTIANSTVTFDSAAGILKWTPLAGVLGNYEIKITGKNTDGVYSEIFTVGVRLKFSGIGLYTAITGTSVTANWTPNLAAQSYQVFKLNTLSGLYETFKTVAGGSSSGTTVTGLSPNTAYTLRVQAVDALGNFDGNVVSRSFTTTELVKLSMSAPVTSLAAGTPTSITVQAYNANGTPQTIGGLPITPLIASGTSSGTFSAVTDNNDGSYTFTFTPTSVGTSISIEVSINISFFLQSTISLSIVPGPASSANSSVSISSGTVVSGNAVTITANVRDSYNNPISTGQVIAFTKTGGTSTGNFSTINNQGNGVYSTSYTGITAGTAQTLGISADAVALSPTTNIQVLAGAPVSAQSNLAISSATVFSGNSVNVTATLKDINGNPVSSGIMVVFNKSGGTSTGTFSSVVNAGSGVYTTTYDGVISGTAQTLSVTVDGLNLSPTVTIAVQPGTANLANSSLTITSPTVISGNFVTATATLKDINNNPIDSGITVSFTKTGGTSTGTFGTVTNQGNGIYNIRYTGVTAGTAQTLNLLINGSTVGLSTTISVLTGAPSPTQSTITISSATVVSGQAVTLTANVRDDNSNPITSGVAITFSKTGGTSTGTFGTVNNVGGGVYTVIYTGVAAGTAQTLNLVTDGSALGPNVTVSVTMAAPDAAHSTLAASANSIISGQTSTFTATLKDLNNNPIDSGITVSFTKTGGTSTGTFGTVTNQGNGVYTIVYTGIVAGTAQAVDVLVNGSAMGLAQNITVNVGSPSAANSSISISSGTVISGQSVTITATVKDLNNNPVTTGVAITFTKTGGTSTGTFGTVNNTGGGIYTVIYTGVAAGTAQTLNLVTDGSALGPNVAVSVTTAAPDAAHSTLAASANSIISGQTSTFTATLKDLNNNPISSGVTVTFAKTGGTSTGTFSSIVNQGNGVYTIVYTGIVAGTAQAVDVLVNGSAMGLAQNITVTVGSPSTTNSSISISSGTVVSGQSVAITATVKDLNNNPITTGVAITFSKTGGTSTGTFDTVVNAGNGVYTVNYTGVTSGNAQTINLVADGSALGPNVAITVNVAPPNTAHSTLVASASSIISGQTSTFTATLKDLNNNPISSGITVTFSKTGGTSSGTFGTITNQGSGVYTIIYTGIAAGTAQAVDVVVNGTAMSLAQNITVNVGSPSAANSSIGIASGTVVAGQAVTVTATVKDLNNNPITTGVAITFSKTGGTSAGTFGTITNAGSGVYTVAYNGVTAGSAQTLGILADGFALGPTTTVAVTPGAPSNTLSTLTISANTVIAAQNVTITATIKDANSNPISAGILVGFDKIGGTSFGNLSAVTNQGNGVYTATYTGVTAGTAQTIQANVNGAGLGPTQTLQVLVGAPALANSSLTLGASTVASGSAVTITAVIKDSQNNPITTQYAITFDTTGGSSTGTISAISNAGNGTFTATYTGSIAGSAQTMRVLADGTPISGLTQTIQVVPGAPVAANSTFSIGSSNVQSSTSTTLSMNLRDVNSNAISSGATVSFTKSAGVSNGTIGTVNNTGSGNYNASYSATTMGAAQTINLVVNGTAVGLSVNVTVTAGPPTSFGLSQPINPLGSIDCNGPYILTLKDTNTNTTSSVTALTLAFSSAPVGSETGTIFSDSSCSTVASSLSIPALTTAVQFYYKSYVPNNFVLTVTPSPGTITPATITINNVPVLSWIGASSFFTMNGSGSNTVMDDSSGGSWGPYDIAINGNFMFAVDQSSNRVLKYNISTNQFVGWIGYVGSTEGLIAWDGGTGCNALALNALTPTWCKGGRSSVTASSTTASNIYFPRNITADTTYIYIANTGNHRISRFLQSDGSFQGWVGKISTTAATSPASCVSAGTNATTPVWCFGGTSVNGTGDGQYNTPNGLLVYNTKIYALDNGNHRLMKLDAATGTFAGWVGRANVAPVASGQPTTCTSPPASGARTPGWCLGGTSQVSARRYQTVTGPPSEVAAPDEGFYNPSGVTTDGTYLYVADGNNYRVVRMDLTSGAFSGYIGYIYRSSALSPTTPTQTSGTYTTTWTDGGVTADRTSNGWGYPYAVMVDSSTATPYLYVTDNSHRVTRVRLSDGGDLRWIGRAGGSPTGGFTGCSSTPVGGTNPGWCLGGSGARYGNTNGTFYNPTGLAKASSKIYVADFNNFRIQRFDMTDGTFDSWIGSGNVYASKWTRTMAAGTNASRSGIDDYSFGDMATNFAGIFMNANNLFVADPGWHRIKKYNRKDGSVVGYIGQIQNSGGFYPTGPDSCVGYTSGMTPDWCTGGGRTTSGSGIHGYNNPFAVAADGTYVYIANYSNHRVDRVRITDALYLGWIGTVSTTPTDGDPACLTANPGDPSPNWCIGGTATSGNLNGQLNAPRALHYDTTDLKLYIIDATSRIMKVNPADGSFAGVIGGVASGTGCTVTNSTAAGWCTTATGSSGTTRYGSINAADSITTNSTYIFVADSGNSRIARYTKTTGAPAGFISKLTNSTNINTTVTGGACNGVTAGYPRNTPGWCSTTTLGLTMNNVAGNDDGSFNSPRGVWADETYVYVTDTLNNRLVRVDATSGAPAGWKGMIATTTGMTDPDCIAAGIGGVTPKWCSGGTSAPGLQLGAFDTPTGLFGDANYLYVHDGRNNRILTVPKN